MLRDSTNSKVSGKKSVIGLSQGGGVFGAGENATTINDIMSKYVKGSGTTVDGHKSRNTVGVACKTTADHCRSHGRNATSASGYGTSSSHLIQSSKNNRGHMPRKTSDVISRNHAQQPMNTAATNYAQLYEMKIKESLSKGTSMLV